MNVTMLISKFAEKNIKLVKDWAEQCLNWVTSEYTSLSNDEIIKLVYEQWLTLDFRELEFRVLPLNVSKMIETVISEPLYLQMNYVIDIARPKHIQLQKIRSKVNEDHHEEVDAKRMLKLLLTDGIQDIAAIEYKHIDKLNLNLPPGTKILLKPPIQVRRGQILLEPGMIEITGGKVESLQIPNCTENILAAALNEPLRTSNVQTGVTAQLKIEVLAADELDELLSDEFFDNHLRNLEEQNNDLQPNAQLLQTTASPQFAQLPENAEHKYVSPQATSLKMETQSIPQRPILTIEQLLAKIPTVHKGVFAINVSIERILERITASSEGYAMKMVVKDDTGELVVDLNTNAVAHLIELSPEAFCELQESAKNNDMIALDQLQEVVEKFALTLSNFNGACLVQIEKDKDCLITKIL